MVYQQTHQILIHKYSESLQWLNPCGNNWNENIIYTIHFLIPNTGDPNLQTLHSPTTNSQFWNYDVWKMSNKPPSPVKLKMKILHKSSNLLLFRSAPDGYTEYKYKKLESLCYETFL